MSLGVYFAYALLFASISVFILWIVGMCIFRHWRRLLVFIGGVMGAVFLLQCAAVAGTLEEGGSFLDGLQQFSLAFVGMLQYLSLDAAYDEMFANASRIFPQAWGATLFAATACVYTVVAPLAGGVALLDILCNIFPRLRLFFNDRRKTKYVFSELNEQSISLAESIFEHSRQVRAKRWHIRTWLRHATEAEKREREEFLRIRLIFTDVYTDPEEEGSRELLDRAKAIGAICIRTDLRDLKLRRGRRLVYFLMDNLEADNIDAAVTLMVGKRMKTNGARAACAAALHRLFRRPAVPEEERGRLWSKSDKVDIYIFSHNEEADEIVRRIYGKKDGNAYGIRLDRYPRVTVKVIKDYRNLVYRLLDSEYPLCYSHLANKAADRTKLIVTILGCGKIGEEFFAAAYWCGQIGDGSPEFNGTSLTLNVISRDAKTRAEPDLQFRMPEAFTDESGYCSMNFCEAEYGTAAFTDGFDRYCLDSDYVLVAFGDDNVNLQAAAWVKRRLDTYQAVRQKEKGNPPKRAVINFVVESADLCASLRHEEIRSGNDGIESDDSGCILNPFGSLRERFDYRNIYLSDLEERAWLVDCTHGGVDGESDRRAFLLSSYNFHSSIASALHYRYKLISVGAISDTACLSPQKEEAVIDALESRLKSNEKAKNKLLWLEHRRWCAYMRTIGYRCPTVREFLAYQKLTTEQKGGKKSFAFEHKNDFLRLHPCLVECGKEGMTLKAEDIAAYPFPQAPAGGEEPDFAAWLRGSANAFPSARFDALDLVSLYVSKKIGRLKDFKAYDIDIIRNLYLDTRRQLIVRELKKGNFDQALRLCDRLIASSGRENDLLSLYIATVGQQDIAIIFISEEKMGKLLTERKEGDKVCYRVVAFSRNHKSKESSSYEWDSEYHKLVRK